jgi:hypothetical protein
MPVVFLAVQYWHFELVFGADDRYFSYFRFKRGIMLLILYVTHDVISCCLVCEIIFHTEISPPEDQSVFVLIAYPTI